MRIDLRKEEKTWALDDITYVSTLCTSMKQQGVVAS